MHNKIVLNFTRVVHGGGVQNALSFLENLEIIEKKEKFVLVVDEKSELFSRFEESGFQVFWVSQYAMDFFCRKYFERDQICFTFFGPPWLMSYKYLINICGVAYSNLFYPEIDFWKYFNYAKKNIKKVKDYLRFFQLALSDYWIFETEALANRAVNLAKYPSDRVGVVRMSPSSLISSERVKPEWRSEFEKKFDVGSYRLLFLASANPNKRIINIAPIISRISQKYHLDFKIEVITTLDSQSTYYSLIYDEFCFHGIEKALINLDFVPYEKVSSLISCCNAMCLFSVLESFSNNMVEAWKMKVPLIATDSDWSRSEAGEAALFVNPEDINASADLIYNLMTEKKKIADIVNSGVKKLKEFPTSKEKTQLYVDFLENCSKQKIVRGKESVKRILPSRLR